VRLSTRVFVPLVTFAVLLSAGPKMSYAQVSTEFSIGYCVDDANTNGVIDFAELPLTSKALPSSFGANFASVDLYSYTRSVQLNGALNETTLTLSGTPSALLASPFDGTAADADGASNGAFVVAGGQNLSFNIDNRCAIGATRTDTDAADDTTDTHATAQSIVAGTSIDAASRDMAGFSFEGDLVLDFTADVGGDISFDDGGTNSGITMSIGTGSEIYGDLLFQDGAVAAAEVVLSNAGSVENVDLSNTSNVQLTNTGTIGSTESGSGVDGTNVDVVLTILNSAGGQIAHIDGTDTNNLTITNATGGSIDSILLNAQSDPVNADGLPNTSDDDVNTSVSNSGTLGVLTADRVGQFTFTNTSTGVVSSPTQSAIVLSNSANIEIVNAGAVSASSSDTMDVTNYTGDLTLTNSGSFTASTRNAIAGNGSSGSFTINNNGTMSSVSSRVISLQNVSGDIVLNNGNGTSSSVISTSDSALVFSDTGASDAMSVTVNNKSGSSIAVTASHALIATSAATASLTNAGTISAGVSRTVDFERAGTVTITNSGTSSSLSAGSFHALSAASASGSVSLTNEGTVRAYNRTVDFTNVAGSVTVTNSGTIEATHAQADAESDDSLNFVVDASRGGSASAAVAVTNAATGRVTTNSDRAVGLRAFNSATDTVSVTNSGTLSAGRDKALDFTGSRSVTLTQNAGAVVSAGRDKAVDVTGVLTSLTVSNAGSILAGASSVGANAGALRGALDAAAVAVSITNAASGTISSLGGNAIYLTNIGSTVSLTNSGIIRAGDATTESDYAVRLEDIGNNSVTFTNQGAGAISASNQYGVSIEGASSLTFNNLGTASLEAEDRVVVIDATSQAPSLTFNNQGTISATDDSAAHLLDVTDVTTTLSLTNSGTLSTEGAGAITGTVNASGVSLTLNNSGTISAEDGSTVYLQGLNGTVDFDNSGTLSAGHATQVSNDAVRLLGINGNIVNFDNLAGGALTATGTRAVQLEGASTLRFTNAAGATISATDDVVVFGNTATTPTIVFTNAGTISGSASTANHVLDFSSFQNTVQITNSGTISSSGTNAIIGTVAAEAGMSFTNSGSIASFGANAVEMGGFGGNVNFTNSGAISSGGEHAVHLTGGDNIQFTNSGTISATGSEAVFLQGAIEGAHVFTNSGTISSGGTAFRVTQGAPVATPTYQLTNSGTISTSGTGLAVDFTGLPVTLVSTGSVTSAGATAMRVGTGSTITIGGKVQAAGANPIALALEGTASQITLNEGARLLGDISALDGTNTWTDGQKHRVILAAADNASYYYDFEPAHFRFFIGTDETERASGFSAGTSNYASALLIHHEHGDQQRNVWRQMSELGRTQKLKSVGFASSLEDDGNRARSFLMEGDRSGLAQSVQQNIFGWFDAELIFMQSTSEYELNKDLYGFDTTYTGVGLGFTDILPIGPFSASLMVMGGLSDNATTRRIYSNTNTRGFFDVRSSYDATHLDIVYELLADVFLSGAKRKLSRRKPYRMNLEMALGGSLHSEQQDRFAESTYLTTSKRDIQSLGQFARLRFNFEGRNAFSRLPWRLYSELSYSVADLLEGTTTNYTVGETAYAVVDAAEAAKDTTLALGGEINLDAGLVFSLSLRGVSSDNDFDKTMGAASLTWQF
jgi:hypothetical protein